MNSGALLGDTSHRARGEYRTDTHLATPTLTSLRDPTERRRTSLANSLSASQSLALCLQNAGDLILRAIPLPGRVTFDSDSVEFLTRYPFTPELYASV